MSFPTFPVGLRLEGRACLVVGSGPEAAARAHRLLGAGAEVRVIAEQPSTELRALAETGAITLVERGFEERDLHGIWLSVLADRDAALAERLYDLAQTLGVFFCAVDEPRFSSYSHLGIARAGPLSIAIGTGGSAPALTRRLREELERILSDSGLAEFVERLAELREQTPPAERAKIFGRIVEGVRFEGRLVLPDEAKIP